MTLASFHGFVLMLAFAADEWEGLTIREVRPGTGWVAQRWESYRSLLHAQPGQAYTLEKRSDDLRRLLGHGVFEQATIDPRVVDGRLSVVVSVVERDVVLGIEVHGNTIFSTREILAKFETSVGRPFDQARVWKDAEILTEMYVSKGHAFFRLHKNVIRASRGVHVVWRVDEGPMVSVESIEFSGLSGVSGSDLQRRLRTKENDVFLFIPTGRNPYVERNLEEDLKWIQVACWTEGWLDARAFVEDVTFNETKTAVRIRYHVQEGRRYVIRNLRIRGNALFSETQIRGWLTQKSGEFYSERALYADVDRIREKYGEAAYVLSVVDAERLFAPSGAELDILFDIQENEKVSVGEIRIRGNSKTRDEVIRRHLTRAGFLPGEEFNRAKLEKAVRRLRDSGWFGTQEDPTHGVRVRMDAAAERAVQDVWIDVEEDPSEEEGRTGNLRFAAGYSSAFGILGMVEITQRNFDIADLPTSLSDLINGTAFAGGGQFLRLRFAPAQRRQTGSLEFREPYLFGWELGLGLRAYHTDTTRESWDERRTGGSLFLEKILDPFRLELGFSGYEIGIDDLADGAPAAVASLEGSHQLFSLLASVTLDTRNSAMMPVSGARLALSWEYAGQGLGGDFDFNKWTLEGEGYWTVLESPSGLKHVLSGRFTLGLADQDPPFFERFYSGGRGSIRGFEYRGIGPREDGDPVGGRAYVFGSVEYTFPLFTEMLRGAVFFDVANLSTGLDELAHDPWRTTVGVGVRFLLPFLSQIPIALDFGFPLSKGDEDEGELITLDIGRLF